MRIQGAFDPDGNFDYFELWSGVSRTLFDDKLEIKLYNYWSPDYFGETGNNDVLEFSYSLDVRQGWTCHAQACWQFRPPMGYSERGWLRLHYWSVALAFGFHESPPLELEIRYWDSFDVRGFTCPPSGVDACNNLVVGSLKATF